MPVEREADRRARDEPDPLPETEDGSSTTPVVPTVRTPVERSRAVGITTAAEESSAIGFPLDRSLRPPFEAQDVHRPHRQLSRISSTSMAEQRRAVGQVFRFQEQLAEGRMRQIVGRRGQDDLLVAGDVDFTDPRALIHDRHPADFHVVFRGHGHVELRRDAVIVAAERRLLRAKLDDVVVGLCGGWMIGG
jgi:hypothetical protein